MISMFTSDSQHPPRSRHAVHLGGGVLSTAAFALLEELGPFSLSYFSFLSPSLSEESRCDLNIVDWDFKP